MTTVFVLQHAYTVGDRDEVKMIGVYASITDAEVAVERLRDLPGFDQHPDGFHIDAYRIGEDHWREGFATLATIMVSILDEGTEVWRPVHAEILSAGRYRIVSVPDADEKWAFGSGAVVLCEERTFEGTPHLVAVSLAGDAA